MSVVAGCGRSEFGELEREHALVVAGDPLPPVDGLDVRHLPGALTLVPAPGGASVCQSAWIDPGAPFFEALVSFNADVPENAGLVLEMRVRRQHRRGGQTESPWLRVAGWGDGVSIRQLDATDPPVRAFTLAAGAGGKVDVDYFRSAHLWDSVQWRMRAAGEGASRIRVRRVGVCTTAARWTWRERPDSGAACAIELPARSQKTDVPGLAGRLCSPTSVSMVLGGAGLEGGPMDVAARTLDPEAGIYGNWPRNVQAAYELGLPGVLVRIRSMAQAERILRSGTPIIASIRVDVEGELCGAPYRTTGGHLIVLRGVDEAGDVRVHDPAGSDAAGVPRTYRRGDLERVWINRTDGTAYLLIRGPAGSATRLSDISSEAERDHARGAER